ncbi:MAG: hypothetical protein E7E15_09400 [Terrisporobacter othiniensis]|uniref:hypothetical protein n=1 Tax=Terrisporobacter othiniensis TaxID=1577792 RepID=UPI0025E8CDF7|nr:hypothetical protein [Terrisporobacter othiniensis]MDU2201268.1 hypothetical protein [Terrisporobacter othiniensis]
MEDARERILGEYIYAPINQTPFDRSLLDGYALIAKDAINASKENPKILKVVDEVFAGTPKLVVGDKVEIILI